MTRRVVTGRNTIRFVKDPPPGEKGDGIVSFTVYFKLTETLEPPSTENLDEAHGWFVSTSASCPRAATAAMPYLWECDVYVFDNISLNKSVLRLSQTMLPDKRPNLLEQTAFEPGYMDKWLTQDGDIKVDVRAGYNAFGNFPKERRTISGTVYRHRELLLQRVMNNQEGWSKIKGDSWYTLSFWSRTRVYERTTSNLSGFNYRTLVLHPGTYRLTFNGHCSADAVSKNNYLGVAVWLQDSQGHRVKSLCSWWDSNSHLTETVDTTKTCSNTLTISAEEEETYTAKIAFYAYKQGYVSGDPLGDVTINWWRLESIGDTDRGLLNTYCYSGTETNPGLSGSTYFVDGLVLEHQQRSDCAAYFRLADDVGDSEGWTRHWVSFRTKPTVPPALQNILFRMYNNYVEICQPKLEEGIMPTDWCPNENDPTIHYSHNPRGDWNANTRYYYCGGIRDVVRDRTAESDVLKTWYRMKKRTDNNGYQSSTHPYLDTEHWEQAERLNFVASELLMAEEAVIDNAIVRKLRTNDRNTSDKKCVEVSGNEMSVFDVDGNLKTRVSGENITGNGVADTTAVSSITGYSSWHRNFSPLTENITLWTFNVTASNNIVRIPKLKVRIKFSSQQLSTAAGGLEVKLRIDGNIVQSTEQMWLQGSIQVGSSSSVGQQSVWYEFIYDAMEGTYAMGQHTLSLYIYTYIANSVDYTANRVNYEIVPYSSGANYVLDYVSDILEIGANGLKASFGSATKIVQFIKSNGNVEFMVRSGDYGILIDNTAVKVLLGGVYYTLGRDSNGKATLST